MHQGEGNDHLCTKGSGGRAGAVTLGQPAIASFTGKIETDPELEREKVPPCPWLVKTP